MQVIQKHCVEKGVPLMLPVNLTDADVGIDGCRFSYNGLPLYLPLLGEHQLENASVALRVIETLRSNGFTITDNAISEGFRAVRWPGRMELISLSPTIVIDSAHNRGGIDALAKCLDTLFSNRRITAIMGMMQDKEYEYCINTIARRCTRFISTVASNLPRSLPAEQAAELASAHCADTAACNNVSEAISLALKSLQKGEILLICGSVYVAGEARRLLATQ